MGEQDKSEIPGNMPGGSDKVSLVEFLKEELIDHLFPWSEKFWKSPIAIRTAGVGLAVTVTLVWILAAAGRLGQVVVISWWIGWSVYEVLCRRRCKPWVKEGPWWERQRRKADTPDIIFYVATKNLLIGVILFLILALLGIIEGRTG